MKRASTTQKVTKKVMFAIIKYARIGEGVIVRYHGRELAITGFKGGIFSTLEGVDMTPEYIRRYCTVRKGLPLL